MGMRRRWLIWLSLLAALDVLLVLPVDAQLDKLRKHKKDAEVMQGDDAPMALVPEGEFGMGVDGTIGLDDERPLHKVWLAAYFMDLYEVTTSPYVRFLAATGRTPPWLWDSVNLAIHGDRPVIGVDWDDADAYCRWAGKRLPTEAEWEKAARGTNERRFPWGNQAPTAELANFAVGARFSYSQALMPVGHYDKAASPFGLYDMAGNVWEWVQDWYDGGYYERSPERNPAGPEQGQFKVLRGGGLVRAAQISLNLRAIQVAPEHAEQLYGFSLRLQRSCGGREVIGN